MRLLLDTHALIWFFQGDTRLSASGRAIIDDVENIKVISPASFWEIAIKVGKGNLELEVSYDDFVQQAIRDNNFTTLPIEPRHTSVLTTLPHHHGDPFDRLLIAQAMVEGITILGVDARFDAYPVERLW